MLLNFLEILKYILPAVVVLIASIVLVKGFLKKEQEQKRLDILKQYASGMLQVRLQAYERLAIFLERMHPSSMISKYYTKGSTSQDLQLTMVQTIRAEYEYNLSQQIYVSKEVWEIVKSTKEQMIAIFNRVGANMEMGVSSSEFIKYLTEYILMEEKDLPIVDALDAIHQEAKKLLYVDEAA